MKKLLLTFYFGVFTACFLSAANDSIVHRKPAVKVNAGFAMVGYEGALLEIPVMDSLDVFFGGEYNYNKNGWGYTIRAGTCFFRTPKKYFSFHLFYRSWQLSNVPVYGLSGSMFNYNGTDNSVLDPVKSLFFASFSTPSNSSSSSQSNPSSLENAKVDVLGIGFLWGKRKPLNERLFMETYMGTGFRVKLISYEYIGSYDYSNSSQPFTAVKNPRYSDQSLYFYPEFKIGLIFGWLL